MNTAIILAGGVGQRIGADIPKQFIDVLGKPIMAYTLETFQRNNNIDEIVLVCVNSHIKLAEFICKQYGIEKVKKIISGGKNFIDSCINGIESLKDIAKKDDIVIITSADRPLISNEEINDAIEICKQYGSGIAARPCSLCMFEVSENKQHSSKYLRDNLMQTATPWAFEYASFVEAIQKYKNGELLGCEAYPVAIYAAAGNEIYFSKSNAQNIKITEKYDIALFENILKNNS